MATTAGRPEFILSAPPVQVAAANAALTGAGAQLLRIRPVPALGRQLLIYDLRRALDIADARALVAQAAPAAAFDAHHLYRYASGPRLYAGAMIGAPPGCRLPASVAIGLIEGPVDAGHPALRGARLRQGSALLPGERPDDTGHGTAMAALIVGEDPRGALAGFAPPTPARRSISPRPAWTSGWRRDAAAATPASGTSYAAPIVTALAARLRARSADALRAALRRSAADLGPPGRDTGTGWGLVRASGC